MALRRSLALLPVALVAGCGSFPQTETAVADGALSADYPALLPMEELRAAAAPRPSADRTATLATAAPDRAPAAEVTGRAARLRARAARLRGGAVIDTDSKERLGKSVEIDDVDDDDV